MDALKRYDPCDVVGTSAGVLTEGRAVEIFDWSDLADNQ